MWVPPNHPFRDGFSIINPLFWGTPIYGHPHMDRELDEEFPQDFKVNVRVKTGTGIPFSPKQKRPPVIKHGTWTSSFFLAGFFPLKTCIYREFFHGFPLATFDEMEKSSDF